MSIRAPVTDDADPPSVWPQPTSMRRPHQIAGAVLLAFGLFVVWYALSLRYYTSLGPGPGFFSFWLGVMLSLLAVVMIASATFGRPEPPPAGFFADAQGYLAIGVVVFGLIAAILLMRPLGFCLTMTGLVFVVLLVGRTGLLVSAIGGLIGGFGVYFAFVHWLRVPLPAGLLGI